MGLNSLSYLSPAYLAGAGYSKISGNDNPVPSLNDVYQAATGNPDAIKEAYDKAIAASQAGAQKNVNFLMGNKANAQAYFTPMQQLFERTYGSGIQAPQAPGMQSGASLNAMYKR